MTLATTTTAAFEADVLASPIPVLVDFTAAWCGPCRMVTPVLSAIARDRTDLTVLQVDADTNPELTRRYRVLGLPAMALFVGGELRTVLTGARPRAAIERHVDETLAQLVTRK